VAAAAAPEPAPEPVTGPVTDPQLAPPGAGEPQRGTLAVLRVRDARVFFTGHALASVGTWMQSLAQDWLVLELTGSASAVGLTMALQFLPVLLLGLHGGAVADRFPKRRVLLVTQTATGLLSAVLAVLCLTGEVRPAHVYLLALAGGVVFAVDHPTRQVFVTELVPPGLLRGAVSLTAAVSQASRLVGPATGGLLISTAGIGWAFAATAVCSLGPLLALVAVRSAAPAAVPVRAPGQLRQALRHVAERPHVAWTVVLVGVVGTFGLNFPIVISGMARTTFGGGADLYGLLQVAVAAGSVTGALLVAGRASTRLRLIVAMAAVFSLVQASASLAPGAVAFGAVLFVMGATNLAFQAMAGSSVQLWVEPSVRGRVMGLYSLALMGGTPVGAPLVGWVTEHHGPRAGLALCGLVPLVAALVVAALVHRGSRPARAAVPGAPAPAGTGGTGVRPAPRPRAVRSALPVPTTSRRGSRAWRRASAAAAAERAVTAAAAAARPGRGPSRAARPRPRP